MKLYWQSIETLLSEKAMVYFQKEVQNIMSEINGKWLSQKLAQNGFGPEDLAEQTGLDIQTVKKIIESNEGTQQDWDIILDTLNDYPEVIIPAASVLDDLNEDIEKFGEDGMCIVYYGVNQNQLAFCEYQCLADLYAHGANVPTDYLASMQITLQEAKQLFTKQNYSAMQFTDE